MEEARAIEEAYDEKLREERQKEEEEARAERLKARETMRELRAQRAIERDLKSTYHKANVSFFSPVQSYLVLSDPVPSCLRCSQLLF